MTSDEQRSAASHHYGYAENKEAYILRLKRIEGQVRGLQRLLEEDTYCIDVVIQISAATSALRNVAVALMQDHLSHCVSNAIKEGTGKEDEEIAAAMKAIQRMIKS